MNTNNPLIQTIEAPGRVLFVGDLHGCYNALGVALRKADFDPAAGDILVSVGDLVDRGPDNLGCLELMNEPWFYAVRGNHEDLAVSHLLHPDVEPLRRLWAQNGGRWFFKLPEEQQARARHLLLSLAAKLPLALEIRLPDGRRYGVVHAELPVLDWLRLPELLADAQHHEHLTWSRQRIKTLKNQMLSNTTPDQPIQHVTGIDAVISGHTIVDDGYQVWGNWFYIDGGAFLGNPLTLLTDQDIAGDLARFGDLTYGEHYDLMQERLDTQWDEMLTGTKPKLPTSDN